MKRIVIVFLFLALAGPAFAFDHSYKNWNQVLGEFVVTQGTQSRVKYRALKKSPAKLEAFVKEVAKVTPEEFAAFSKEQQTAFLLNAYNALVVKLVYPEIYGIDEIGDITGLLSSPFSQNFFTLLGEESDLNDIVALLRKDRPDPRIHFALCNSGRSSASLRAEAYIAERLDAQLEDQTRNFINDRNRVSFVSGRPPRLFVSNIFETYRTDFPAEEEAFRDFILKYLVLDDDEVRDKIRKKTTYLVYGRENSTLNRAQE